MSVRVYGEQIIEPRARAFIAQAVREVLDDPDFGLELSDIAKKRLKAASRSKTKKGTSLTEIKKKYY